LTIGNISRGSLDFAETRFVPESYYSSLDPSRSPRVGDILYTVVGATYGRPALVDTDRSFCVQRHIAIVRPASSVGSAYLCTFLRSPVAYAQASARKTGSAQPTLPLGPLRLFAVPLPPLVEQHGIVARVDALMGICDGLESSLRAANDARGQFAAAAVQRVGL